MKLSEAIDLTLNEIEIEGSPTSRHTYHWHSRNALHYWGPDRLLGEITRRDVQIWIHERRKNVSAATVAHELSFLSRVYRVAWDAGEDVTSPCTGLRKPPVRNKRKRILSELEESQLRQVLGSKIFTLVEFAMHTSLRRLEIFRLRPRDVVFFDQEVDGRVHRVGLATIIESKTGKSRSCPLNPIAAAIAAAWMRSEPGEFVFMTKRTGERLNVGKDISRQFQEACAGLGLENLRFHDLRHTAASRASENGAHVEDIQQLLGHETKQMTERYITRGSAPMWRAAMAICK